MKLLVTQDNVQEMGPGRFVAEASELGIAPGVTPRVVPTNLGNGLDFVLNRVKGEYSFEYVQTAGSICLTIFND